MDVEPRLNPVKPFESQSFFLLRLLTVKRLDTVR